MAGGGRRVEEGERATTAHTSEWYKFAMRVCKIFCRHPRHAGDEPSLQDCVEGLRHETAFRILVSCLAFIGTSFVR